ncbi:ribonuclease P protein component [Verminephrobacter aporrectodeae subsp. tuberculatae]|uniref:Ribonuclease P protein component n=1 Tax=Verminephrobacter aporrectodeae subsp. tuberculatae TaxID=1110392 RepID=A0ABT3KU46_9BURK|nr:ribonuclease P protein component [Verminephrobacter aporrectodeae]MCW5321833.1 ribonuclease P protein component [Verminephrobacter aporrectodeae subsp. tuberculatae]MCW8197236.1 ribonuclease P protein component [Verminephrobacter aporrectodeae subsp. tuberculatae]
MQRLKTRAQFQAAMAGGSIVSRTAHFALHRLLLDDVAAARQAAAVSTGSGPRPSAPGAALFAAQGVWLGAVLPKRWARRAVTRNAIKRQIYTVAALFETRLALAAHGSQPVAHGVVHVVRLRSAVDRKQFPSATSEPLQQALRTELLQLFGHAARRSRAVAGVVPVPTAPAGAGAP